MKPLQIFGYELPRAAADEGELKAHLDRECSVPRLHVHGHMELQEGESHGNIWQRTVLES